MLNFFETHSAKECEDMALKQWVRHEVDRPRDSKMIGMSGFKGRPRVTWENFKANARWNLPPAYMVKLDGRSVFFCDPNDDETRDMCIAGIKIGLNIKTEMGNGQSLSWRQWDGENDWWSVYFGSEEIYRLYGVKHRDAYIKGFKVGLNSQLQGNQTG